MTETSSLEPKRRRFTGRARIPNEKIRWFICSSAAALREKGGYSDGFTSHGEPDAFPYREQEIGFCTSEDGTHHGHGTIERAKECGQIWHAIGNEYREVLAVFYNTREPGRLDTPDGSEQVSDALQRAKVESVVISMRIPPEVMRAKGIRLELSGVAMLLQARGEKTGLAGKAIEAIRIAHEIWEIEDDQIERSSDVRWKTGVLK